MEFMKNLGTRFFKIRGKKGTSILEFALVFPVFILCVFAMIDFSYYYYYEATLEHITRTTLRTIVTGKKVQDPFNPGSGTNTNYLSRKQTALKAAKEAAMLPFVKFRSDSYGATNPSNFNSDLITFITTTNDGASYQTNQDDLGGSGARIKMTMKQNFTFLTPLVKMINPANVTSNQIQISTTYKAEDFDIN